MHLNKVFHHIIVQVLLLTLVGLSGGQGSQPECGPECLHCKTVVSMDCCPELPQPCHKGDDSEASVKTGGCGIWTNCSSLGENTDYLTPGKMTLEEAGSLLQSEDIFVHYRTAPVIASQHGARPPPQDSCPIYILNCSFLN